MAYIFITLKNKKIYWWDDERETCRERCAALRRVSCMFLACADIQRHCLFVCALMYVLWDNHVPCRMSPMKAMQRNLLLGCAIGEANTWTKCTVTVSIKCMRSPLVSTLSYTNTFIFTLFLLYYFFCHTVMLFVSERCRNNSSSVQFLEAQLTCRIDIHTILLVRTHRRKGYSSSSSFA